MTAKAVGRDPSPHSISLCSRRCQENKDAAVVHGNQKKDGLCVVARSYQVEDGVRHYVAFFFFFLALSTTALLAFSSPFHQVSQQESLVYNPGCFIRRLRQE